MASTDTRCEFASNITDQNGELEMVNRTLLNVREYVLTPKVGKTVELAPFSVVTLAEGRNTRAESGPPSITLSRSKDGQKISLTDTEWHYYSSGGDRGPARCTLSVNGENVKPQLSRGVTIPHGDNEGLTSWHQIASTKVTRSDLIEVKVSRGQERDYVVKLTDRPL